MIKYEVTVAKSILGYLRIEWRSDNQLHCEHGPAITDTKFGSNYELWYEYGLLHCEHGPAVRGDVLGDNPDNIYYLEGVQYSEEDFKKKLKKKDSCDGDVITHKGKKYKLTLQE